MKKKKKKESPVVVVKKESPVMTQVKKDKQRWRSEPEERSKASAMPKKVE